MRKISILLIVLPLWGQSCSSQELTNYTLADVPLVVDVESLRPVDIEFNESGHKQQSPIFTNVRYIPLETNRDCLIGVISKVLIRDNRIYVADFYSALALFVYDMDGRFLFKIARMGKGAGDYVSFRDFDVHSNGDIYMFDHFGKKIIVFSQDGKYKMELRTDYIFSNFCLAGDKIYWANLIENGKRFTALAVHDPKVGKTEFLLKNKKFLLGSNLARFVSYRFYQSPPDIIYYAPMFSEIIYAIEENCVRPAIGVKNLRIPPEHIIRGWELTDDFGTRSMQTDELYFKENLHVYETNKYITFRCTNKNVINSMYVVYDKSSGTFSAIMTYVFHTYLAVDGIKGSTGKDFFSVMNPDPELKEHLRILQSHKELANWKEEDNPVVVIFDLDM